MIQRHYSSHLPRFMKTHGSFFDTKQSAMWNTWKNLYVFLNRTPQSVTIRDGLILQQGVFLYHGRVFQKSRKFLVSETIEEGVEKSKGNHPVYICFDNKDLKRKVCDSDCS